MMAWRRPGDKPLSEPKMESLLMHICVTWPKWVKKHSREYTRASHIWPCRKSPCQAWSLTSLHKASHHCPYVQRIHPDQQLYCAEIHIIAHMCGETTWSLDSQHKWLVMWNFKVLYFKQIQDGYTIPTFGIRARAALSCVGGRNAGGYGCNSRVPRVQAPIHSVANMYIYSY